MTTTPATPAKKPMSNEAKGAWVIVVFVFLLIGACANNSSSSNKSSGGSSYSSSDSSPMACTHWHNIMGDVQAGILTDAELRTKISEVRSSASSDAVRAAATHMLAAVTTGNKNSMTAAFIELEAAC